MHCYVIIVKFFKVNKAIFMQFGKLVIEIENRLWYTSYCSDDRNNEPLTTLFFFTIRYPYDSIPLTVSEKLIIAINLKF